MKNNGDIFKKAADDNGEDVYGLDLYFILSTYKVLTELKGDYQVDLRNMDFRKFIGFESKIIDSTEYGKYLPDITRGVDEIHINCDIVKDSITDGQSSSTIAVIPVNDIVRSLPFHLTFVCFLMQIVTQIHSYMNLVFLHIARYLVIQYHQCGFMLLIHLDSQLI